MWLGVGSASGPIRKAGGGGGCCRFMARYEERGGGGGGCCRILAQNEERGGGGGGGAVGFWPHTKGGGRGEYDRVSGGPGYSTVVEFMRADINRQRNRAAIL